MREKTTIFQINGKPMLVPDAQVEVSYEDLDSGQTGRDESGVMHRYPVRYKVPCWSFTYEHLTEQEKQYMEGLFPDAATFSFTHPDRINAEKQQVTAAYRSKYSISWKNARTGLWSNYGFQIIGV
ncbi:MAG: hypothetical protein IJO28_02660 [Oscillospiraceae bacterium]|nr:hypothetical protein [Oscillospiraceae bacterium]